MSEPTKTCAACGIDVGRLKRVKDPAGRYYCEPCWVARGGAVAPTPARLQPPRPRPLYRLCMTCGGLFKQQGPDDGRPFVCDGCATGLRI